MDADGSLARRAKAAWRRLPHPLRWAGVAAVGGTLIVVGIALLVLPGPGTLLIAMGLLILATEFVWAETLLHRLRRSAAGAASRLRRSTTGGTT